MTHSGAAHPTNVNCDLVLGTHHGFGFGFGFRGKSRDTSAHTRDGSAADSLVESPWPRGNVQLSAEKKASRVTEVESTVKLQMLEPSEDVPWMICLTGMPENII